MSKDQRQRYSREFKLQAVKRSLASGKPAAEVARELEISITQLYKWRDEFEALGETGVFPGAGRKSAHPDQALLQLKKENARLKMERDILKKSLIFFARDQAYDSTSCMSIGGSSPSP